VLLLLLRLISFLRFCQGARINDEEISNTLYQFMKL